jgi:hypothetical protein
MKWIQQIAAFAVSIILAGCSRTDQARTEKSPDTPVTAENLNARHKDTASVAVTNRVTENKDEFIVSMDRKLKELDAKIGELGQKAEGYKDDAKVQADQALSVLREQREQVKTKFEEVKKASAEAWKEVKAGFASAMDELEKAFENAKSKFS